MIPVAYPELDEVCYRAVLENGLTVAVVKREGFTKKLAYFVTDYGATREFCTPETAWPVPYRLVPVHPAQIDNSHYTFVSAWAEPDVAAAACALRELYANPELRAARGEAARAFIARHFSRENFRASLETLLNET